MSIFSNCHDHFYWNHLGYNAVRELETRRRVWAVELTENRPYVINWNPDRRRLDEEFYRTCHADKSPRTRYGYFDKAGAFRDAPGHVRHYAGLVKEMNQNG